MSRVFELIVFDWDGTLMDSAAQIVACVQAAAREIGWKPQSEGAVRNIIGLGLIEACRELYPERSVDDYQVLADAYRKQFFSGFEEGNQLFDGACNVLTSLKDWGYLLAIATGKSRGGLQQALRETGLESLLDASRCGDEAASKPHPQMLQEIMAELDVEPRHTLMVGDTEYDMAMARNAGTAAIGVCYGAHEPKRLISYEPLACLGDISELLEFLRVNETKDTCKGDT